MANVAFSGNGFEHLRWLEPMSMILTGTGRPLIAELVVNYERQTAGAIFHPTKPGTVDHWTIVDSGGEGLWHGPLDRIVLTGVPLTIDLSPDDVDLDGDTRLYDTVEPELRDAADVTWPVATGDWEALGGAAKRAAQGVDRLSEAFTNGTAQLRGHEIQFRGVTAEGKQIVHIPADSRARHAADCEHDFTCVHGKCLWCKNCVACITANRPATTWRVIEPIGEAFPARFSDARPSSTERPWRAVRAGIDWSSDTAKVTLDAEPYEITAASSLPTIADPCKDGHTDCVHGRCVACEDCPACESGVKAAPF